MSSELKVDTISENTTASGVTIDGVVVKDNAIARTYLTDPGKILQVVSATNSTEQSTTSTSYVDITSVTLNITPSSTSNKILVIYNDNVRLDKSGSVPATGFAQWQIVRDSTAICVREFIQRDGHNNDHYNVLPMTITHLDSPSSTSSVTYKAQMKNGDSTSCKSQYNNYAASIMALEIEA